MKDALFCEMAGLMPYDVGRILTELILCREVTVMVTDPEKSKYAKEAGPPRKTGAV